MRRPNLCVCELCRGLLTGPWGGGVFQFEINSDLKVITILVSKQIGSYCTWAVTPIHDIIRIGVSNDHSLIF